MRATCVTTRVTSPSIRVLTVSSRLEKAVAVQAGPPASSTIASTAAAMQSSKSADGDGCGADASASLAALSSRPSTERAGEGTPPDRAESDHCGSCRACLDVCPTAAFPAPYRLDARRCISYLTIEHKGPIPRELRPAMGNRIFGCDDCLAVCPWNKFARAGREAKLAAREELRAPRLGDLVRLDDAAFRALFAKSPVKRTGRSRFVRNVLIAIGNSGDPALAADAERSLEDEAPLVRGAAVWALSRLAPARLHELAAQRGKAEPDASVRAEWAAALAGERGR